MRFLTPALLSLPLLTLPTYAADDEAESWIQPNLDLLSGLRSEEWAPRMEVVVPSRGVEFSEFAHTDSYRSFWSGNVEARLAHVFNEENRELNFLRFRLGQTTVFRTVEEAPPIVIGESLELPQQGDLPVKTHLTIVTGLTGAFESDEAGQNYALSGGGELVVLTPKWGRTKLAVGGRVDVAVPLGAEAREVVLDNDDPFARGYAFGVLTVAGPGALSWIVQARHWTEFDTEEAWEMQDFNQHSFLRIFAQYFVSPGVRSWLGVRNVHVGYSTGRELPHIEDEDRWIVGVTLQ